MSKKITIFQISEKETGPKTIEVGGSSIKGNLKNQLLFTLFLTVA